MRVTSLSVTEHLWQLRYEKSTNGDKTIEYEVSWDKNWEDENNTTPNIIIAIPTFIKLAGPKY
jgi:hypothetical protein